MKRGGRRTEVLNHSTIELPTLTENCVGKHDKQKKGAINININICFGVKNYGVTHNWTEKVKKAVTLILTFFSKIFYFFY